jgi:hypothetical protein
MSARYSHGNGELVVLDPQFAIRRNSQFAIPRGFALLEIIGLNKDYPDTARPPSDSLQYISLTCSRRMHYKFF